MPWVLDELLISSIGRRNLGLRCMDEGNGDLVSITLLTDAQNEPQSQMTLLSEAFDSVSSRFLTLSTCQNDGRDLNPSMRLSYFDCAEMIFLIAEVCRRT